MKQMFSAIWVLAAACLMVSSKSIAETDVVTEILRAIEGRKGMEAIGELLKASHAQLVQELPLVSSNGKEKSYTFFAPTGQSFLYQIPQDAANPLKIDDDFRLKVLIRHFSRQQVPSSDLAKLDKLVMADSKEATLSSSTTGVWKINDAEIQKESIPLANDIGVVYVIDRVFMTDDEVYQVLEKNPRPGALSWLPPADAKADEPAGINNTPLGAPLPHLG